MNQCSTDCKINFWNLRNMLLAIENQYQYSLADQYHHDFQQMVDANFNLVPFCFSL